MSKNMRPLKKFGDRQKWANVKKAKGQMGFGQRRFGQM
jgi:hypothetical protein